jgi:hypothetical protein
MYIYLTNLLILQRCKIGYLVSLYGNTQYRESPQETLAIWLDQGSDTEGGTPAHCADSQEVPLSAALTAAATVA